MRFGRWPATHRAEKPAIQALERAQGWLRLPNGQAVRGHNHEYKRHGTTTLFAALEVHTGAVAVGHYQRRRRREFLDFMNRVVAQPCVQEIFSHFSTVHILVNNAGIGGGQNPKLITDFDDDFWDMSVSVNLTAPYLLTKAFLPSMIAQGWGRIINIASGSGMRGGGRRTVLPNTVCSV